jgi:hypothetical protein
MSEKPEGIGAEATGQLEREKPLLVRENQGYSISTYRYLRLAIVTVIFTLVVSLGLERSHASCWNDSISSYYFTPVHTIFVAALGVIGVALFAIRGGTLVEEVLLNMAGFLAPVVAFVPTGWSSADCPSNLTTASKSTVDTLLNGNRFFAKFSANNLVSFVLGGLIALTIALILTRIHKATAPETAADPKELLVPAIGSTLVVITGFIWHMAWPASFNTHAHSYAAIFMFIFVGIVMVSTAERDGSRPYRRAYFTCPAVMFVGGVTVVIVGKLVTWHHQVLVLEIVEATVFVTFWLLQTIQLWDGGLPQPEKPENVEPLRRLSRRIIGRVRPGRRAPAVT